MREKFDDEHPNVYGWTWFWLRQDRDDKACKLPELIVMGTGYDTKYDAEHECKENGNPSEVHFIMFTVGPVPMPETNEQYPTGRFIEE